MVQKEDLIARENAGKVIDNNRKVSPPGGSDTVEPDSTDVKDVLYYKHPEGQNCPVCSVVHNSEYVEWIPADYLAEKYADMSELESSPHRHFVGVV